jgi:hypothetical protein
MSEESKILYFPARASRILFEQTYRVRGRKFEMLNLI